MTEFSLDYLVDPDSTAWTGLAFARRYRISKIFETLREKGHVNRSDVIKLANITLATASVDFSIIMERTGDLIWYDKHAKCYRLRKEK